MNELLEKYGSNLLKPVGKYGKRWLLVVLAFVGTACGSQDAPDVASSSGTNVAEARPSSTSLKEVVRTEKHEPLFAQAVDSPALTKMIARLQRAGWTGGTVEDARILSADQGAEALAVSLSQTARHASIELLYLASEKNADARIVVRPKDATSRALFTKDLDASSNGSPNETTAACDPGCNSGSCEYWSCDYIEDSQEGDPLCRDDENSSGHYWVRRFRGGTTNPTNCAGLYADYFGNGQYCPFPNSSYTYDQCAPP